MSEASRCAVTVTSTRRVGACILPLLAASVARWMRDNITISPSAVGGSRRGAYLALRRAGLKIICLSHDFYTTGRRGGSPAASARVFRNQISGRMRAAFPCNATVWR